MTKQINEIIACSESANSLSKKRLISLLPVLEHQYTEEVLSELRHINVDSNLIIRFAITECSDYWRGLALEWLLAGHPVDELIASELESFGRGQSGKQHDRHEAFRLAIRWRRSKQNLTTNTDMNKKDAKDKIDDELEMKNVNNAAEDFLKYGTTNRRCLRCGKRLILDDYGSGYAIRCETINCLYVTFRGL